MITRLWVSIAKVQRVSTALFSQTTTPLVVPGQSWSTTLCEMQRLLALGRSPVEAPAACQPPHPLVTAGQTSPCSAEITKAERLCAARPTPQSHSVQDAFPYEQQRRGSYGLCRFVATE
jgi:hypothetical protein